MVWISVEIGRWVCYVDVVAEKVEDCWVVEERFWMECLLLIYHICSLTCNGSKVDYTSTTVLHTVTWKVTLLPSQNYVNFSLAVLTFAAETVYVGPERHRILKRECWVRHDAANCLPRFESKCLGMRSLCKWIYRQIIGRHDWRYYAPWWSWGHVRHEKPGYTWKRRAQFYSRTMSASWILRTPTCHLIKSKLITTYLMTSDVKPDTNRLLRLVTS